MGGGYAQDENMEHRPYTSVRKLFYNFPNKSESCKTNKSERCNSESKRQSKTPDTFLCNEDFKALKTNEVYPEKKKVRNRFSLNVKFISRFSESYSDLYLQPMSQDSNLLKSSLMSRSENKLNWHNSCSKSRAAKRVKSFDPSKFQPEDSIFNSSDEWREGREYAIYDDTESCLKIPIDEYSSDEEDEERDDSLTKFKFDSSWQQLPRGSSSSTGSHWSSVYDSQNDNLPWTKRQRITKKNKSKSKQKAPAFKISTSFDQIRNIEYDKDKSHRTYDEDCEVDFWSCYGEESKSAVMSNLLHSRRSLTIANAQIIECCDGVFGCG